QQLSDYRKLNAERVKIALEATHQITKDYFRNLQGIRQADNAVVSSAKFALEQIVNARRELVNSIRSAVLDTEKQIRESMKRVEGLTRRGEDLDFEERLEGQTDTTKIF